jgi:hypothetical protein
MGHSGHFSKPSTATPLRLRNFDSEGVAHHTFEIKQRILAQLLSAPKSTKLRELQVGKLSFVFCAPVAQLDRATGYEPVGRAFESLRAHHKHKI